MLKIHYIWCCDVIFSHELSHVLVNLSITTVRKVIPCEQVTSGILENTFRVRRVGGKTKYFHVGLVFSVIDPTYKFSGFRQN